MPDQHHHDLGRVAACPLHEADLKRVREATGELDAETWARLEEALDCPDCQLILAILTEDASFLPDGPIPLRDKRPPVPNYSSDLAEDSKQLAVLNDVEVSDILSMDEHPAASVSGIEDDTIVRSVRIWSNQDSNQSARRGPIGIVPKDCSQLELIGMFDPSNPRQSNSRSSCLAVMWRFRPGMNAYNTCLPVDEIGLFLLEGELEWQFEGGQTVRLQAGPGGRQILWASADPAGVVSGLPPFTIKALGGTPALAVAKLYSWNGIHYSLERNGLIRLNGTAWDSAQIRSYWRSIETHVHQMPSRAPFTTSIPISRADFSSFIESHQRRDRKDPHSNARLAGQLIDADLPGWPIQNSYPRYFRLPEIPVGKGGRKHPILDFRLLAFPGEQFCLPPGRIEAAHHRGFETIIPLAGSIRCGWVELSPAQSDDPPAPLSDFGTPTESRVDSSEVSNQERPQILLLCSEIAHGFTSGVADDSYALLMRSYDLYHERPPQRTRETGRHSIRRIG